MKQSFNKWKEERVDNILKIIISIVESREVEK